MSSILSAGFRRLRWGAARGLCAARSCCRLEEADILADTMSFSFAPRLRGRPRLQAAGAGAGSPALLDHAAAGLDYTEIALSPEVQANAKMLPNRARAGVERGG